MFDQLLIEKCADPSLKPALLEQFIDKVGSQDPLAVTVKSGDQLILVPTAKTPDEAMAIVRQHVGNAIVRVGVTQYPAGLGIKDASELKPDIFDACENINAGTALFAKVYRIVVKWYGSAPSEALDDALFAWGTGYFEGKSVFQEPDPGRDDGHQPKVEYVQPAKADPSDSGSIDGSFAGAGMRIDLSRIGAEP